MKNNIPDVWINLRIREKEKLLLVILHGVMKERDEKQLLKSSRKGDNNGKRLKTNESMSALHGSINLSSTLEPSTSVSMKR